MAYPAPQVGDLIEFKLIGFLDEQTCINVFHYTVGSRTAGSGGPTIKDAAERIGLLLWDDGGNGLAQAVTSDYKRVAYSAQIIKPARSLAVVVDPVTNAAGVLNPPTMPSGVSVVCQKKGVVANRHNQGRLYAAGIAAGDVSGSALVAGSPTAMAFGNFTGQLSLSVTIVTGGITMVLAPVLCPLPAGTPLVVVSFGSFDDTIRYQRRRELRVGI